MGTKVTLADIANLENNSGLVTLNTNQDILADEFDLVFYRDGSFAMTGTVDMDSNRIINLPDAVNSTEPVTYGQLATLNDNAAVLVATTAARDAAIVAQTAAETARTDTEAYYNTLISGYLPAAPKADLIITFGQSLYVARGTAVTSVETIPSNSFMFNGGLEKETFNDPTTGNAAWPMHVDNATSMVAATPLSLESVGPGMLYQSAQAGSEARFFMGFGRGSSSLRLLRAGNTNFHFESLKYSLQQAVKLIRAAGYEPNPVVFFSQGHANTDERNDGNLTGETPTTQSQYELGQTRLFEDLRRAIGVALAGSKRNGSPWDGVINVEPLLTGGSASSAYTLVGRKAVNAAQLASRTSNVRLMPAFSQFVEHCATDLVHPKGEAMRKRGELHMAFAKGTLKPPVMTAKAVVGSTVELTFDQPVKVSTLIPDGSGLAGLKGIEVFDNVGGAKTISSVAAHGSDNTKIVVTPNNTTNLSGAWSVSNGQHDVTTGVALNLFPRTQIVGTVDVGVAADGSELENASIPQEI